MSDKPCAKAKSYPRAAGTAPGAVENPHENHCKYNTARGVWQGGISVEPKIRVQRRGSYTVLPNALLRDRRLSVKAKGLACVALSLPPGWEYSVAGLSRVAGCGRDMTRAALRELESAGYLAREQLHDSGGKFASCRYVISEEPSTPADPAPDPEAEPLTENPSTDKPSTEKPFTENPTEIITDSVSTDVCTPPIVPPTGGTPARKRRQSNGPKTAPDWKPEHFAGFWDYYTRGENKQAAIRAWDKLRPSDELIDTMAQALQRQVASEGWQQGIGIPYAATWINQRRWEDEYRGPCPMAAPPREEALTYGWR